MSAIHDEPPSIRAPVTEAGLTSDEAARRLAVDGPNVLPTPRPLPAWRKILAQLTHFFAVMLWVAGALAFVAGMPQLGVAIFVVIMVNALFAFAQEQRAERAAEELQELLPSGVVVVRDGILATVEAAAVVRGDLVVLEPGDRVPADLELRSADALAIDASLLTGESVPVTPGAGDGAHAGTYVTNGAGRGVVTATGERTELAAIARLTTQARRPRTPLAHELDRIVRIVASIALGVGVTFFSLSLLLGSPARDGFLFAVGVTVALVPEGLLPTVTLSLAMGAQRMADRKALVRRLEAVETLGATTFICTDKTGTLTKNQMAAVAVWTPSGSVEISGNGYEPDGAVEGAAPAVAAASAVASVARAASQGRAVFSDGAWVAVGDPMEAAIDALASRIGAEEAGAAVRRLPFDPDRRRASIVTTDRLLTKGAPDSVLPRCDTDTTSGEAALAALAERGLRVLAVAARPARSADLEADADTCERNLDLLGLIGLHDPPREGVRDSIAAARRAGIKLAMLTGDHPRTAAAIGREVGFISGDARVVEGSDLPEDPDALGALLDHDGIVISRVSPADKLRIATALQRRGHVVAMTGDGVNDGPALQAADVGVAMGAGGTDVARAAADLVLLDDHFDTIVTAVEHGRATFTNIHRFLTYHLVDNVAELAPFVIWALTGGRFPLMLGVLQIICLDLGTDVMPSLALGSERPSPGILERPPERRHLIDRALLVRVFAVLGPAVTVAEFAAFLVACRAAGWSLGDAFPAGHALAAASGAAFSAVVIGQIGSSFACRSATRPPWRLGWTTNRLLLVALGVTTTIWLGLIQIPAIARLLDHAAPPWPALLVALVAAPWVLAVDRAHKGLRARRQGRAAAGSTFEA